MAVFGGVRVVALVTAGDPRPGRALGERGADPSTWVVGHIKDRITHRHLTWAVTNWRHEWRACSDSTGQAAVIANARAQVHPRVATWNGNALLGMR